MVREAPPLRPVAAVLCVAVVLVLRVVVGLARARRVSVLRGRA